MCEYVVGVVTVPYGVVVSNRKVEILHSPSDYFTFNSLGSSNNEIYLRKTNLLVVNRTSRHDFWSNCGITIFPVHIIGGLCSVTNQCPNI